jgi:pimeloyl-ACP methyl ester carboxylesterase
MAASARSQDCRLEERWTPVRTSWGRLRLHSVWCRPHGAPPQPLVLLHGMASSWRQWRTTMLRLCRPGPGGPAVPTAALDFPGFGLSQQPRRRLEVDGYVQACEAWARASGLGPLAAVGHSFGGAILVRWAGLHPERFRSVGLLAPASLPHPWHRAGRGAIRWPLLGRIVAPVFIWIATTYRFGPRFFGYVATDFSSVRREEYPDLQWGCRRAREMLRALDYYEFPTLERDLAAIRAPVRLGWGALDRVVPCTDAAVFTRVLPNATLTLWEGCGHVPMLERREECDALLRDVWLDRGAGQVAVGGGTALDPGGRW